MSAQTSFAQALTQTDAPVPPGLVAWNGSDPAQRFNVYRNNVVVSLIKAMQQKFPVVQQITGDEFFDAMAGIFVRQCPPQSAVLSCFGDDFPDFIAAFPPAATAPYLADMARLEAARVKAYHAADAAPLPADAFAAIAPDQLANIRLRLHPSLAIVRSHHAIASLWGAHHGIGEIASIAIDVAEDALIARPENDVLVAALAPGVAVALLALAEGASLGMAVESANAATPQFQAAELFRTLIEFGIATAIDEG